MKGKWIFVTLAILAVFFYINKPILAPLTKEEKLETHETISKLKEYVDALTADVKDPYATDNSKSDKTVTIHSVEEGKVAVQEKLYSIMYNILHTKPGQALLEKILYNPDVNTNNKNSEEKVNLYRNNSLLEILTGDGALAECGDLVTIKYVTRMVNGQEIENTYNSDKPVMVQIGDHKVIRGLEYALIGMKEGGMRRVMVPPKFAYKDSNFASNFAAGNEFISIDVELLKLQKAPDTAKDTIRVFRQESDNHDNKNAMTLCGSELYFTYKISTLEGVLISKSEQIIHINVGSANIPSSLNKLFYSLISPAHYTIILPSSLLKYKNNFLPANIKLPSNTSVILDIDTKK